MDEKIGTIQFGYRKVNEFHAGLDEHSFLQALFKHFVFDKEFATKQVW